MENGECRAVTGPRAQILAVFGALVGLMTMASLILPLLKRFRSPEQIEAFQDRLKAWWTMAVVFVIINLINGSLSLAGFAMLSGFALREYLTRVDDVPKALRYSCYLAVPLQYLWVYMRWYGMFIVFIPVFFFLYVPTRVAPSKDSLRQAALIHWGLMAAVFCVSHAAYLLVTDTPPVGGAGLMLFVMSLTELGEAIRTLWSPSVLRLAAVLASAVGAASILGPYLTPLTQAHTLLAGFIIGLGGEIASHRLADLRVALDLGNGPLKRGQGGALNRIIGLTYTAPLFFHGFRYFYQ